MGRMDVNAEVGAFAIATCGRISHLRGNGPWTFDWKNPLPRDRLSVAPMFPQGPNYWPVRKGGVWLVYTLTARAGILNLSIGTLTTAWCNILNNSLRIPYATFSTRWLINKSSSRKISTRTPPVFQRLKDRPRVTGGDVPMWWREKSTDKASRVYITWCLTWWKIGIGQTIIHYLTIYIQIYVFIIVY